MIPLARLFANDPYTLAFNRGIWRYLRPILVLIRGSQPGSKVFNHNRRKSSVYVRRLHQCIESLALKYLAKRRRRDRGCTGAGTQEQAKGDASLNNQLSRQSTAIAEVSCLNKLIPSSGKK